MQLTFEGPFEIHKADGGGETLDPSQDSWERLAALFALRHDTIRRLRFTNKSDLSVEFTSGRRLTSSGSDGQPENWQVSGPGGVLIVGLCGQPAIYDGEPDNQRAYRWDGEQFQELPPPDPRAMNE
jgi:hypothetical protein